ncbi:MAG: hypothetical protein JWM72_3256 [Actinomycetia bacterium]|nr:hypothetical protein [Actinomycetes bacterium]MDQ1461813.1 hypothetical protein [Actinomycetota bacterium]
MPTIGADGGLLPRLPTNALFENVNTPPSDATIR